MEQETLKKLQIADDPTEWESPSNFDWAGAISRVRQLKPELENLIDRTLKMDECVQDASFFTELSFHKPSEESNDIETVLGIRFSAFGNLFTTWSHCSSEQFLPSVIKHIIKTTENHGFIYASSDELNEQYTGQHEGFRQMSWWNRFFDYI